MIVVYLYFSFTCIVHVSCVPVNHSKTLAYITFHTVPTDRNKKAENETRGSAIAEGMRVAGTLHYCAQHSLCAIIKLT